MNETAPNGDPAFKASKPLTLGVELELGIVEPSSMDLAAGAPALAASLEDAPCAAHFKAEITNAMIEINSSVHTQVDALHGELRGLMDTLTGTARSLGLAIVGGGTHPFQDWADREISEAPRFRSVSQTYGYLAKQFTVFGQHVHVGCESGDDAVYLTHALTRFAPHMIALSAASPFWRGTDTGFDCCRLNVVNAFPLSGVAIRCRTWSEFTQFVGHMHERGVLESLKDLYWDVRPKPEFGTVEVRVCDTPLSVQAAADMAALVQALTAHLLDTPRFWADEYFDFVYARNRFQACRFGLQGEYIGRAGRSKVRLRDAIADLLGTLEPRFHALGADASLARLTQRVHKASGDALWLRRQFAARGGRMQDLVSDMSDRLLAAA